MSLRSHYLINQAQARIHPHARRRMDHRRTVSSTRRNVAASTPAPIRSRSPLFSTSSSAATASPLARFVSRSAKRTVWSLRNRLRQDSALRCPAPGRTAESPLRSPPAPPAACPSIPVFDTSQLGSLLATLRKSGSRAAYFGYTRDHFDISRDIGERRLFPAIRNSAPGTIVVASGFSCRHQIQDFTATMPSHPAELLQSVCRR